MRATATTLRVLCPRRYPIAEPPRIEATEVSQGHLSHVNAAIARAVAEFWGDESNRQECLHELIPLALETAEKHEEEPAPIAEGPTGATEYVVQVQTSETAYAASDGICSVSVVGSEGEGPELALNDGAAVKKGELVEVRFTADLGEVSYVEFKNTSSETWRPHWVKTR